MTIDHTPAIEQALQPPEPWPWLAPMVTALAQQGWCLCDQVFSPDDIRALLANVQDEAQLTPAAIGRAGLHQANAAVRRDKTQWLTLDDPVQGAYLMRMEQLRCALNEQLFLGLREYEAHYARFDAGDFYRTHVDALKGQRNRVITTVTYLNPGWLPAQGGELVLYDEAGTELQRVLPTAGTTVFFLSEAFPHEVLPATTSRYSVAGWFRVGNGLGF